MIEEELRKPRTQTLLERYYGRKMVVICRSISADDRAAPSYQELIEQRRRAHERELLERLCADERVRFAARLFGVDQAAIQLQVDRH